LGHGLSNGTNKSPHKIGLLQKEVVAVFGFGVLYPIPPGPAGPDTARQTNTIVRHTGTQPPSFRSQREEHACKLLLHLPGPATRVIEISQAGSGRPCSGAGVRIFCNLALKQK
jgi:hypothetical protein